MEIKTVLDPSPTARARGSRERFFAASFSLRRHFLRSRQKNVERSRRHRINRRPRSVRAEISKKGGAQPEPKPILTTGINLWPRAGRRGDAGEAEKKVRVFAPRAVRQRGRARSGRGSNPVDAHFRSRPPSRKTPRDTSALTPQRRQQQQQQDQRQQQAPNRFDYNNYHYCY